MTYDTNNVFARILRKELDTPLVYEDEYVVAFKDINPQAPIHILVITKTAYTSFQDFMDQAESDEIVGVMKGVSATAAKMGAVENGLSFNRQLRQKFQSRGSSPPFPHPRR